MRSSSYAFDASSSRLLARGRAVLAVLSAVVFVAALLDPELGKFGLIPFGLLLAFSTGSADTESGRSVILTNRKLELAAAMEAAFGWSAVNRGRQGYGTKRAARRG